MMQTVKKNDLVYIRSGKDSGKSGVVERVLPKQKRLMIAGVNFYKKHIKPSKAAPKGGIVAKQMPIDQSNVMPICPKCQKPTRVGSKFEGKIKIRFCRKCQENWS